MPMYNASCWLDECLQAVLYQDFTGTMELSVFDDASTVSWFVAISVIREVNFFSEYETSVDVQILCMFVSLRMTPGKWWRDGGRGWRRGASL